MAEDANPKRLTDMFLGKLAACLLFVLWLVSMSMFDTNACTSFPLVAGMGVIVLLALSCLAAGGRVVRFTWLNWVSLLIGVYFLVRCLCSYSVVESWRESIIIVGCFIFYVAGILAAQSRSASWMVWAIVIAAALNLAAFYILRDPSVPIEWTGRPAVGFMGANNKPVSLLIYKNSAGAFFAMSSALLFCCCLWCEIGRLVKTAMVALAAVSAYTSMNCGTRDVYLLYPVLVLSVWFLHVVNCLYQNKKLGWRVCISGVLLLCGVCIAVYELLFSGELYTYIASVNTHLRGFVWKSICKVAPDAPLWGYGASSVQWEITPYYDEWSMPNYAHNEFLQAWMDYGVIGVSLVGVLLLLHGIYAFRVLASERISHPRRVETSFAVLILCVLVVCALADFPWHSYSLAVLTAFACGILTAPAEIPNIRKRYREMYILPRAARGVGRGCVALCCLFGIIWCGWMGNKLYPAWAAQWEYSRMFVQGADDDAGMRHRLLAEILPSYPSPALMDCFYMLPIFGISSAEQEHLLRIALSGNPKQLYTISLLCENLTRQGRFEESEKLFRRSYAGDGMPGTRLANWPAYYALNLLHWGRSECDKGNVSKGYSIIDYALNIHSFNSIHFRIPYGRSSKPWEEGDGYKPGLNNFIIACKTDAVLMGSMGVQKDDSWKEPLEEGGKPALYRRWGDKASKQAEKKFREMKIRYNDKKNVN